MNEKNLIPNDQRTPNERRENASKAGKASGKARREKKEIRKILEDYLDGPIEGNEKLMKIAQKAGIDSAKNIKELYVISCALNTLRKGGLSDLKMLAELLGELSGTTTAEIEDLSPLVELLKRK